MTHAIYKKYLGFINCIMVCMREISVQRREEFTYKLALSRGNEQELENIQVHGIVVGLSLSNT